MKKLILTKSESETLKKFGCVDVIRNGLYVRVEENDYFDPDVEEDFLNQRYSITILICYEKVILK